MKDICKRLQIDTKTLKERTLLSVISSAKDSLISPVEYELKAMGITRSRGRRRFIRNIRRFCIRIMRWILTI